MSPVHCVNNYLSKVLPELGLIHTHPPQLYVAGGRATFQHVRQTHPCHNTRSDLGSHWGCLGPGSLVKLGGEPLVIHQQPQKPNSLSHRNWCCDVLCVRSTLHVYLVERPLSAGFTPSPTRSPNHGPTFVGKKQNHHVHVYLGWPNPMFYWINQCEFLFQTQRCTSFVGKFRFCLG